MKSDLPAEADSESYVLGYRPAYASRVHGHEPVRRGQRRLRGGYYLGGIVSIYNIQHTERNDGRYKNKIEEWEGIQGIQIRMKRRKERETNAQPARPSQVASPGSSSDCL